MYDIIVIVVSRDLLGRVLNDSYDKNKDNKGETYWSSRLDFVTEVELIKTLCRSQKNSESNEENRSDNNV